MKAILLALVASVSVSLAGNEWMTDWEAAKAKATAENKPILINFTGSDWCGWCIKLEKEVFSKDAFQKFAAGNLILMEVDFPREKEQPAEVKKQNEKLDKQFKVEGYPTVFLLDPKGGNASEDIGYREGGAEAYVAHLKELAAKQK